MRVALRHRGTALQPARHALRARRPARSTCERAAGRARRRRRAPDADRVQAARAARAQRRPGRHAPAAAGRRVGRRVHRSTRTTCACTWGSCAPSSRPIPAEPHHLLTETGRRLPARWRRRAEAPRRPLCVPDARRPLQLAPSPSTMAQPRMSSRSDGSAARPRGASTLGALGVVYGDIGTSPLYTMKEVFTPAHRRAARTRAQPDRRRVGDLLGADAGRHAQVRDADPARRQPRRRRHHGAHRAGRARGGSEPRRRGTRCCCSACSAPRCSTATASSRRRSRCSARWRAWRSSTPALEALRRADRGGDPDRRCSRCSASAPPRSGKLFGPVIVLWFVVLARRPASSQIVQQPAILAALDPLHARATSCASAAGRSSRPSARSCWRSPAPRRCTPTWGTSAARRSSIAWIGLVLPSLALNYMGQGALLMRDPSAIENPFYRLFPDGLLMPALVLATLRGDHRVAGGDLGRLFDDAAGDPARLPAAHAACATPRRANRARSTSRRSTGAARRRRGRGARLRQLVGAGRRLRHRGDGDDADHDAAHLLRRAPRLAAVRCRWRSARPRLPARSTRCWSPAARSSSSTAAGSRSSLGAGVFAVMAPGRAGASCCSRSIRTDGLELRPFVDSAGDRQRCRAPRARRSTRWPTRAPCRRRCCTT